MFFLKRIQIKMVVYFIFIVVIPVLILYIFMFNTFQKFSMDKVIASSLYDTKLISYSIDQLLKKVEDISMNMFSDTGLLKLLVEYGSKNSYEDQKLIGEKIDVRLFDYVSLYSELESIYLYDLKKNMFKQQYKTDFHYPSLNPSLDDYSLYGAKFKKIFEQSGKNVWFFSFINDGKKSLTSARLLKNIYNTKPIGYLVININQETINNYIKNSDNEIIIINSEGEIISSCKKSFIEPYVFQMQYFKQIQSNNHDNDYMIFTINQPAQNSSLNHSFRNNTYKYLAIYSLSKATGLYTVNIAPLDEIYARLYNFKLLIGIAALLCIVFIFIIVSFFSFKIFIPVVNLQKAMKKVESGNLDIQLKSYKNDEIGGLYKSFNNMVSILKTSFENKLKQEQMKKQAEFKALQAQINPHFLYNTLNSVKWLADIHKVPNISKMITSLVKLIRHTVGTGGEYITIMEEIENIRNYEYIEKVRFGDKFSINYDIDETILDCLILKLLLQPIIENCIFHGLKEIDAGGIIWIKGSEAENNIFFEIEDNGLGITPERISEILDSNVKNKNSLSSIGIRNIHERLKLNYGEEYGVTIESLIQSGTKVIIKMPKIIDKPSM